MEQAEKFIVKVATVEAQSPLRLFDLVADAFADYDNDGRMNGNR